MATKNALLIFRRKLFYFDPRTHVPRVSKCWAWVNAVTIGVKIPRFFKKGKWYTLPHIQADVYEYYNIINITEINY